MSFKVASLARDSGDSVLYEPGFRTIIETHLPIIKDPSISRQTQITPDKIHQYEADFYGLLCEMEIPLDQHWIYLRANDMTNPNEFGRTAHDPYVKSIMFTMILPSTDFVDQLRLLYISTRH